MERNPESGVWYFLLYGFSSSFSCKLVNFINEMANLLHCLKNELIIHDGIPSRQAACLRMHGGECIHCLLAAFMMLRDPEYTEYINLSTNLLYNALVKSSPDCSMLPKMIAVQASSPASLLQSPRLSPHRSVGTTDREKN